MASFRPVDAQRLYPGIQNISIKPEEDSIFSAWCVNNGIFDQRHIRLDKSRLFHKLCTKKKIDPTDIYKHIIQDDRGDLARQLLSCDMSERGINAFLDTRL
ncbi:hypothetical protein [Candidatus Synchoanobacter obligatus]|uniref:Uncharacterized protein n=1 Tax=Candidatus Synchoanobacter obligatus TaxID=2919597 RepID=A0ABT1L4C9_9GAMM|nr:hypothetical protein [Candidatus Synchoanobacter obligatus]MCP8352030.1 hypothetical protein [Candidatus Synchoanobacter obligatus]